MRQNKMVDIHKNTKGRNWLGNAIKRPNRTRAYMLRKYGAKAFNKDNTLKVEYIQRAIKETNNTSLRSALQLALNLHRSSRKKK